MSGNTLGTIFKITTWGESHGKAIGVIIEGCPSGLKITQAEIQKELNRRKPGQSHLTTQRTEPDKVTILSGIFQHKTTGAPISLVIRNTNQKKADYEEIKNIYRPSHGDFSYEAKYGIRDPFGGGRASARETIGRVAAGVFAKKILNIKERVEILAYVKQIKDVQSEINITSLKASDIEKSPVRCPDKKATQKMSALIEKIKGEGDSVGGIIECVIRNAPAGLGSPVFNKLDARLAHAMLSVPATKGFELGSGFQASFMKGSEHNDRLIKKNGKILTESNHAGGIVGGISNGMDIIFRVSFKPTSTIMKDQRTIDKNGDEIRFRATGRHDPCVLIRAVPIVEAMAALVLTDEYLIQKTTKLQEASEY